MKYTLVLLGLAASMAAPLSARADNESTRSGDETAQVKTKAGAPAAARARSSRRVIYITSRVATGSHLPLVVSRYQGHYDSMSPTTVYGRPDLDRTGQLSVAGELYQRDPAISSARTGH